MRTLLPLIVLVTATPMSHATAQTACDLQGSWDLVSAKYDNQPAPPTYKSMKIFTKTRFAVVGHDTAFGGPLVTDADRLKFYSNLTAVGGSYVVAAGTWTEKIDYMSDPSYIGMSFTFQCMPDGDRLLQKGTIAVFEAGKKTRDIPLEEVWRRVDRP
jgi:hypothetical protein